MSKPPAAPAVPKPPLVALRSLSLVAAVAAAGAGLLTVAWPALTVLYDERPITFVNALVALCAAVTVLSWAWLQLTVTLVAAAAMAGACRRDKLAALTARLARAAAPGGLRRLLVAASGVALSTGVVALPASATSPAAPYSPPPMSLASRPPPHLDGLPLPDRALGGSPGHPGWITVRPGDSLWAIARRLLPRDADDQEISAAWHQLALANRSVLGSDPDLIHPGTRLRVPAPRRDGL